MPLSVLSLSPAHSLSLYRSNKALGYAVGIDARAGCAKARMRGSYGKKFCEMFVFPLLARESAEDKRGAYMEEN